VQSRRLFISKVATGLAGTLAASNVMGANKRLRIGVIGAGDRGKELVRQALALPNVECTGAADVYPRRLDEVRQISPAAKTYLDYRRMLENGDIDAVLIATPQHLHAEHFIAALDAGKHVYQEKTLALTVEHARRMRAACQRAGESRTVEIGHQWTSTGQLADAARFLQPELMGRITVIHAHMYRNTPRGKPQWARAVYPDMTAGNIGWKAFLGEAADRPFDANRYINWRFFWDYSGGNIHENMCHPLAFWHKAMGIGIPRKVTATGGLFLWKDGRETPDTLNVSMEHAEELLFTWDSGFGNERLGVTEDVLGTNGAITRTMQAIRYQPERKNRPDGSEMAGQTRSDPQAHMRNFVDHIRGNARELNCPFDLAYRVAIACSMAVESYRAGRTVSWDPEKEEIV